MRRCKWLWDERASRSWIDFYVFRASVNGKWQTAANGECSRKCREIYVKERRRKKMWKLFVRPRLKTISQRSWKIIIWARAVFMQSSLKGSWACLQERFHVFFLLLVSRVLFSFSRLHRVNELNDMVLCRTSTNVIRLHTRLARNKWIREIRNMPFGVKIEVPHFRVDRAVSSEAKFCRGGSMEKRRKYAYFAHWLFDYKTKLNQTLTVKYSNIAFQ